MKSIIFFLATVAAFASASACNKRDLSASLRLEKLYINLLIQADANSTKLLQSAIPLVYSINETQEAREKKAEILCQLSAKCQDTVKGLIGNADRFAKQIISRHFSEEKEKGNDLILEAGKAFASDFPTEEVSKWEIFDKMIEKYCQ